MSKRPLFDTSFPDRLKDIMYSYLNTPSASTLKTDLEHTDQFAENLRLYELNLRFVQKQLENLLTEVNNQLKTVNQAKQALKIHKKLGRP